MGFKSIKDVALETRDYIEKRRKGLIKSCKTGYKKLDKILLGGIEWGSVLSIGGRPSVGKTGYSSCIMRGIIANNPLEEIEILDFAWEMSSKSLLLRDLSAETKDSYGDIISAQEFVSDEKMKKYDDVLNKYMNLPWFFEEDPKSTKEFEDIIERRVAADPKKKRIVRIDHSILAKQAASQASQVTMLQDLLAVCVKLKKKSDIIFIVLTQIGREFEERQEDGTDNAFPRRSDPYGGDAVSQSSDVVILLNKPSSYGIRLYGRRGSENSVTVEPDDLFGHVVKNRNGSPDLILRYKENFKQMSMIEY